MKNYDTEICVAWKTKKEEGNLRRIEEMTSCDNIEPRPFTSRDERDIIPLTLECLTDSPPLRALINLSIFSTQDILIPPPTPLLPVYNWGKLPTPTNFLKKYTYADFFAISKKERPVCSVFYFVSSCKEANTLCFVL